MTKRDANRPPRGAKRAVMTGSEYRALIQTYVDRARADQSIAERPAEKARQRLGADIDASGEDE